MSTVSKIEWTGKTWNPIRARLRADLASPTKKDPLRVLPAGTWGYHCERVSPGCCKCYACTMGMRTLPSWGTGLDYTVPNRELVEIYLDEEELTAPLRWRKPTVIFACSMTDWCADFVTDEMRDRLGAVVALCERHTFQFLTKRAERQYEYFADPDRRELVEDAGGSIPGVCYAATQDGWPLPNWWLGVSVEDQVRTDARIPLLLQTPAAVRFISAEPLLGPVDISRYLPSEPYQGKFDIAWIDWVIVGGESGPNARSMRLEWVRSILAQCKVAGVSCFVKQLGFRPRFRTVGMIVDPKTGDVEHDVGFLYLRDRKGGDPSEWPADLCVREMPVWSRV